MTELQPAPITRRLAAFAIDYAILALYIAVISVVFAALPKSFVRPLFSSPLSGQLTVIVALTIPVLLYFALSERSLRQATIGKRAVRLRVVDREGHRISWQRSLLRSGLKLAPWELAHTCIWRIEGWPAEPESPTGLPLAGIVTVWAIVLVWLIPLIRTGRTGYDLLSGTIVQRRP
jgi:uncharacterized RDD family membrane protein YckC